MIQISFTKWRKLMGISKVYFAYHKLDGTFRKAVGTRNKVVAEMAGFHNMERKSNRCNPYAYLDFEKGNWRSISTHCNDEILLYDDVNEFNNDDREKN